MFAAWTPDASLGVISGHRLLGRRAWYWFALVEAGRPLLHITEWEVKVRADPFIVKAPEMWAEHHCVAPMRQWSVGNEAHASAIDEPDEALGRGYGIPTPLATDLEWYATHGVTQVDERIDALDVGDRPARRVSGYRQVGVVHGLIELLDRPNIELAEIPAVRWHRWTAGQHLKPLSLPSVVAHTGLRAPFAFPDGATTDLVLTPEGWRSRARLAAPSDRRPGLPSEGPSARHLG